ncbi:hypothetical protein BH10CYA1_BH10CYA1_24280 [soil metagenome]
MTVRKSASNRGGNVSLTRLGNGLICLSLSCLIIVQQQAFAASAPVAVNVEREMAYQAASILEIRPEVERLLDLERETDRSASTNNEILSLRTLALRKVLLGALDVRRACNKIDIELAYTYALLQREQNKANNVNQLFNLANFAQFSALYTIEPYSRINLKFKQSAILTCVGAGVGTTLPVLRILYNKYNKVRNTEPPRMLAHVLDGGPVDLSGLPPVVERFFEAPYKETQTTRREAVAALWKKRYGVDLSKTSSLCSLKDDKAKSFGLLNTRIVLLWSLHTFIQEFDQQLLALLKMVRSPVELELSGETTNLASLGLTPGAIEAASLLHMQANVEQLIHLNRGSADSEQRTRLEISLLQNVLSGMLEVQIAADKIDQELNYAYDVVLSSLLARRGKGLQRNYEANFIQSGVFSAIAGLLFLNGYPKAGNEIFLVQSGIGTALSTLALVQMQGGSRKIDTPPNSLAQFFNPDSNNAYRFSKLISDFLAAPEPGLTKKSRREIILDGWKTRRVSTLNLDSKENQAKLAAMPSYKRDTIKIVRNRIELLHSLRASIGEFDGELSELLNATEPSTHVVAAASGQSSTQNLNPAAWGAVKVLGIEPHVAFINGGATTCTDEDTFKQKLFLTRKVMEAKLDQNKSVSALDLQIATETTERERIERLRDLAINVTNNANFFQINVLGLISDGPLGLSSDPKSNLYGNRLNIVSGYLVGGLTAATVLEKHGGLRMNKAEPNCLSSVFGMDGPANVRLSPTLVRFFDTVAPSSPNGLTRKQELMDYWKLTKFVTCDVTKPSTQQKLAANGLAHHFYSENITLLSTRIRMLYEVRAVISLMDVGLSELLRAVDNTQNHPVN